MGDDYSFMHSTGVTQMEESSQELADLRAYLEHLVNRFENDLMTFSGTGLPLQASDRTALPLSQYQPIPDCESGFGRVCPEKLEATRELEYGPCSQVDIELLEHWSGSPNSEPLLIVGPFGSGKSVLVAAFALRLGQKALRAIEQGQSPLRVPWPVRLRDWKGYKKAKWSRTFRNFIYKSATLLLRNDNEETNSVALSRRTFDLAFARGQLILLFDGFDELPEHYLAGMEPAVAPTRENTFKAIQQCHLHSKYLLTARPGSTEGHIQTEFPESNRLVLGELTQLDVLDHVRREFGNDPETFTRAKSALTTSHPSIAKLLRRPLFLATWCNFLRTSYGIPLTNLQELMTELLVQCFDARHESVTLEDGEVLELLPELEALLFVFAARGFGAAISWQELLVEFRKHRTLSHAARLRRICNIARGAGFLVRRGAAQWYAVKVPVTEYLAASRLTTLTAGELEDRKRFIHIFQRWVWLPNMHDTLDIVFAILGSGNVNQRALADGLVLWLTQVSGADAFQGRHHFQDVYDDRNRYFVVSAVRWAAQLQASEETLTKILHLVTKLDFRSDLIEHFGRLDIKGVCSQRLAELWINHLVNIRANATPAVAPDINPSWILSGEVCIGIQKVAGWTRAEDAKRYLERLVARLFAGDDDGAELDRHTIAGICSQLEEEAALDLLDDLAKKICESAHAKNHSCVETLEFLSKFIAHYIRDDKISSRIITWMDSETADGYPILFAAQRVVESDAYNFIEYCMKSYKKNERNEASEIAAAAAWHLPEDQAVKLIGILSAAMNEATIDRPFIFQNAFADAAGRLPRNQAMNMIKQWTQQCAAGNTSYEGTLWHAIVNAASHVEEWEALGLIADVLIPLWNKTPDSGERYWISSAVVEAAKQVPESAIVGMVEELFFATPNPIPEGELAIAQIARRLSKEAAYEAVQRWLPAAGDIDSFEFDRRIEATTAAIQRIGPDRVVGVLDQLIATWRATVDQCRDEEWRRDDEWLDLIRETALRGRDYEVLEAVFSRLQPEKQLSDIAEQVATQSTTHAVITAGQQGENNVGQIERRQIQLRRRRDSRLLLDEHLSLAPEVVKRLISDDPIRSEPADRGAECEPEEIGPPRARPGREVQKQIVAAIEELVRRFASHLDKLGRETFLLPEAARLLADFKIADRRYTDPALSRIARHDYKMKLEHPGKHGQTVFSRRQLEEFALIHWTNRLVKSAKKSNRNLERMPPEADIGICQGCFDRRIREGAPIKLCSTCLKCCLDALRSNGVNVEHLEKWT